MSEKTDKNLSSTITKSVQPCDEKSDVSNTTVEDEDILAK